MRPQVKRRVPQIVVVSALALVAGFLGAAPASAANTAQMTLSKTATVTTVSPGDQFGYNLVVSCSGLTEGCVDATVTDVLPAEFEVSSLPSSSSERTVTYDAVTRLLTVKYTLPLSQPAGQSGLPAGQSRTLTVGMRLPVETPVLDNHVITNTADSTAANADPKQASVGITAVIPVAVRPLATKVWSPSSALAQTGAASTVTLGVRNASSTSARVGELTVTDNTSATFNAFDVTSLGPVTYPPGANEVTVGVCTRPIGSPCTAAQWVSATYTGPGPFAAPGGTALAAITGVQFTFANQANTVLPYSADQGTAQLGLALRDTYRSGGQTISPQTPLRITNQAVPSAVQLDSPTVTTGSAASAVFTVQPDTVSVQATKTMFADNSGSWSANGHIVVGENSGLTMKLGAKNTSAGPVKTLVIAEPSVSAPQEFSKIDLDEGRFTWPSGATSATLTVTCRSGANPAPVVIQFAGAPSTVPIADFGCATGVAPEGVTLTFAGVDVDGNGTIAPGTTGTFDVHGTAAGVTSQDVADGLTNCVDAHATTPIASSAASVACKTVSVENPNPGGTGTKDSSGVTTIVPGQPLSYNITFLNTGNVAVTDVSITDPPDPSAVPNPFSLVRLTKITVTSTPASTIEVFDPTAGGGTGAYVPYVASNSALLTRATGFRVVITGELPVGASFHVTYTVVTRDGVQPQEPAETITNCAAFAIGGAAVGSPVCSPPVSIVGASASASLQKLLSPTQVTRPEPGLPTQTVRVKHRIQNDGPMYLKELQFTDIAPDFFDAVDFAGSMGVNFPPGANRVRVDVCTTDCATPVFINGTATGSATPGLPAGVTNAEVRGIRVTFSNSNNSYALLPGTNYPASGSCASASFCFSVNARQFLRSAPQPIPSNVSDVSTGQFTSSLGTAAITQVGADLTVVPGVAQAHLSKGPDSRIGPGDTAPIDLTLENTGTTALVNPVITDPLPDYLTLESDAPGGAPGRPFVITYPALPAGYPPLPSADVTYTPHSTGNRVDQVTWTFSPWNLPPGGKVNIRIYVHLTPGTPADATITNTAGAHGANQTFTCAPGNDSATDNPTYGAGLYCLSSANIVSLSGNAVEALKWSAGDASLGWYLTTSGETVPEGDSRCPSYVTAGVTYTRYPCVALVPPGGVVTFLVHLVNAGTNDLTQAVIVDGLPVLGDKGVLLTNIPRGTDWSSRPTMLTPVQQIEGYGGVTTDYTSNTFPGSSFCTANLQPSPNDTCPAGAFSDSLGTDTTGFRTTMNFPQGSPLHPGDGITLTWTMSAPLTLNTVTNTPIAWNSFAQKSTFGAEELAATEPPKAGVAMRFNTVTVSKSVVGIPEGVTLPQFEMGYRCLVGVTEISSGTVSVSGGDSATLPLQPVGAQCSVWENTTNGGSSPNEGEANAVVLTVPDPGQSPDGASVPISNSFQSGQLTVTKSVTGGAANLPLVGGGTVGGQTFPMAVECEFPVGGDLLPSFPDYPQLHAGESVIYDTAHGFPLPAGSLCSVTELDSASATRTVITVDGGVPETTNSAYVTVKADSDGGSLATIDNQYDAGTITIAKTLSGDASGLAQGPFTFSVECTFGGHDLTPIPVVITTSALTHRVTPLPVGAACAVYETDAGDSTPTQPLPILVGNVIVPADSGEPVTVSADNPFPAGHLTVSKSVVGPGTALVSHAVYQLHVQCQQSLIAGGTRSVLNTTVSLTAGQHSTIPTPLPIGSVCWATETHTGGATESDVDYPSVESGIVVTPQTPNIAISAHNWFLTGTLVVTKKISGPAPAGATYPFTVSCTMPVVAGSTTTYPVNLPAADAAFSLAAGQSRTITAPQGATCLVRETNSHGAYASYVDSDGVNNGVVTIPLVPVCQSVTAASSRVCLRVAPRYPSTTASVTVTNVFATVCQLSVSALSASTVVNRNGTTQLVARATPSSRCQLVVRPPSGGVGSHVQCVVAPLSRTGDLAYCRASISATGRVVVRTLGYPHVVIRVTLVATPKPGVTGVRPVTWVRTWRTA